MNDDVVITAWAGAVDNGDFVCVETYSGYSLTGRDPEGAQHLLAPQANDHQLGVAVLDALGRSRFISPLEDPEEDLAFFDLESTAKQYEEWVRRLVALYGYKTRRALFKDMKSCQIKRREGTIVIGPSHHEKLELWSGDGISKDDYVVIPADSGPTEVGAALRLAFTRCT